MQTTNASMWFCYSSEGGLSRLLTYFQLDMISGISTAQISKKRMHATVVLKMLIGLQ